MLLAILGLAAAVVVLALVIFLAFNGRVVQSAEKLLYWMLSLNGGDIDNSCALLSPVGSDSKNGDGEDYILAQTNGDLVSVLEIRGARQFVGPEDYSKTVANFTLLIEGLLKAGGRSQHSFTIGFRSDPEKSAALVDEALLPMVNTAGRLGVAEASLGMLRARRAVLTAAAVDETVYLIVRTIAASIPAHEKKTQQEERMKMRMKYKAKAGDAINFKDGEGQVPGVPMGSLMPRHTAAVDSVLSACQRDFTAKGCQLLIGTLSTHAALNIIRRHTDARYVPRSWRPRLLGDKPSAAAAFPQKGQSALTLPPRLSRQLITAPISDDFGNFEVAQMGGFWYGSVVLEIMPDDGYEKFSALADRIGKTMPWRASFDLLPNGLGYKTMTQVHAALLAAFSSYNKSIRVALEQLKQIQNEGQYIVAFRVTFTTWSSDRAKLYQQLANLSSAVQSWGSAGCTNETGEPSKAMLSSAAGYASESPAPFIAAPTQFACATLPLTRPSSIWDSGQVILTTPEGRLYPIEFGSRKQAYWSTAGFAPTGSGKSFTLNVINSGLLLAPGAQEVPPITLVDVGKSGDLVMQWYKSILPDHLKDQVVSVALQNDERYTVNPFDTQHGFDLPLQDDVDYLTAVLGTIVPNLGEEAGKFFERVVQVVYEKFGRNSPDAKRWQNTFDEAAARALESTGFTVTDTTTVWMVVDHLFEKGKVNESISAQRFAMPVLSDLSRIASDARVSQSYGTAKTPTQESIIDVFVRNISVGLNSYAILSGVTKFNLGAARAVAIDLHQVIGSTSEEGRRRSGLMYLMARRIGARHYFLKWDEVDRLCPPLYREYQEKRIAKLWGTLKFLQYDESHYFSNIESVTALVRSDLRTGRKYNLVTAMFSQQLDDFPPAVIENTYIFLIMGLGDSSPDVVRKTFGLSDDEMRAIASHCIRPGQLFARFKTTSGVLSQTLNVRASAYEQFAFTTQGNDPQLRHELSKQMPYEQVLSFLAKRFPSGTAEPYFRHLIALRGEAKDASDEALAHQAAVALLAEREIKS